MTNGWRLRKNLTLTIKKPRSGVERGLPFGSRARLATRSFGGLQRIDFGLFGIGGCANMGCHIAVSVFPFHWGIGTGWAIPTGWKFRTAVATLAFIDDLMANPLVVSTPFSGHKRALYAFFNRCTNHWNHPLGYWIYSIKKAGNRLDPAKTE